MYYQNYEDYMRSVLGYPVQTTYDNYIIEGRDYNVNYQNNSELESMYPEIYKKIKSGNYKIKRDSSYYDKELKIADYTEEIKMGEGITNGIFYFEGYYEKDGKMAIDIYDLDKKEFRVNWQKFTRNFLSFLW